MKLLLVLLVLVCFGVACAPRFLLSPEQALAADDLVWKVSSEPATPQQTEASVK